MAARKSAPIEVAPPEVVARAATLRGTAAEEGLRPGFTIAPAYDLLFSAGFPHIAWLTEETLREDPTELALKAFARQADTAWPRAVAHRFARLHLATVHWTMHPATGQGVATDESRALASRDEPFTEDEARRVLREHFVAKKALLGAPPLFVFEALLGADFVAQTCLEALSFLQPGDLNDWDHPRCATLHKLGFVLRRLSPDAAQGARAALEALFTKGAARWPHGTFERTGGNAAGYLTAQLDLVLHGALGATRSGRTVQERLDPSDRLFTSDRAVHAQPLPTPGPWSRADAQLVWLGGDAGLEWHIGQWKKFSGPGEHARLVECLGPVRDARVSSWLELMAGASKAKKTAALWLERHRLAEL